MAYIQFEAPPGTAFRLVAVGGATAPNAIRFEFAEGREVADKMSRWLERVVLAAHATMTDLDLEPRPAQAPTERTGGPAPFTAAGVLSAEHMRHMTPAVGVPAVRALPAAGAVGSTTQPPNLAGVPGPSEPAAVILSDRRPAIGIPAAIPPATVPSEQTTEPVIGTPVPQPQAVVSERRPGAGYMPPPAPPPPPVVQPPPGSAGPWSPMRPPPAGPGLLGRMDVVPGAVSGELPPMPTGFPVRRGPAPEAEELQGEVVHTAEIVSSGPPARTTPPGLPVHVPPMPTLQKEPKTDDPPRIYSPEEAAAFARGENPLTKETP